MKILLLVDSPLSPKMSSQALRYFELAENQDEMEKIHKNLKFFAPTFYWENLAEPIKDFCEKIKNG